MWWHLYSFLKRIACSEPLRQFGAVKGPSFLFVRSANSDAERNVWTQSELTLNSRFRVFAGRWNIPLWGLRWRSWTACRTAFSFGSSWTPFALTWCPKYLTLSNVAYVISYGKMSASPNSYWQIGVYGNLFRLLSSLLPYYFTRINKQSMTHNRLICILHASWATVPS